MCCVFYGYVVDCLFLLLFVFFFKQKTAYEMRISDWSSDVCSSDLVYGSHFAEDLQDARRFGWKVPDCEFDWSALRDNVLAEVSRLEGLYTETLGNNKVEIIRERATVAGPHEVLLGSGQTITAGKILIATGAWPIVPHFPGAEHGITSNEVFHLDT